jgi:hypothetical protein
MRHQNFERSRMDPGTDSGGNGLFQLPGAQQQLIDAVAATKTPVVEVLINGGPLSLKPPAGAEKFGAEKPSFLSSSLRCEARFLTGSEKNSRNLTRQAWDKFK